MTTFRGEIKSVRHHSTEWGFGSLKTADDTLSIVGSILGIKVGDHVEIEGDITKHARYGEQIKIAKIKVVVPHDSLGMRRWLSENLKGIGQQKAASIVEHFGSDLWRVLDDTPERLAEVAGVSERMISEISDAYQATCKDRDAKQTLYGWGLTSKQIARCEAHFKSTKEVIEQLQKDPYQLCELVDGFGFKKSDAVALQMGLPHDHPRRIQEAILYTLKDAETSGHVYIPAGALVKVAASLLGEKVAPAAISVQLQMLRDAEKKIIVYGFDVYLAHLYEAECYVALWAAEREAA
jgi:exodeoxyribonuclease V alpha subunit